MYISIHRGMKQAEGPGASKIPFPPGEGYHNAGSRLDRAYSISRAVWDARVPCEGDLVFPADAACASVQGRALPRILRLLRDFAPAVDFGPERAYGRRVEEAAKEGAGPNRPAP